MPNSVTTKWMKDANGNRVRLLNYRYKLNGIDFRFHLLSECGEPVMSEMQRLQQELCEKCNAHVETRTFIGRPHFAEVLVKNPKKTNALNEGDSLTVFDVQDNQYILVDDCGNKYSIDRE